MYLINIFVLILFFNNIAFSSDIDLKDGIFIKQKSFFGDYYYRQKNPDYRYHYNLFLFYGIPNKFENELKKSIYARYYIDNFHRFHDYIYITSISTLTSYVILIALHHVPPFSFIIPIILLNTIFLPYILIYFGIRLKYNMNRVIDEYNIDLLKAANINK
jgi:hypothetical protein